jgi:hypothetical protein
MDKTTRNAIERATQQARKLLDDDFSSQLEGTYDILRSKTIAQKGGVHLSARQQFHRDKIVAAIEHKRAAGNTAAEAVTDYVRDAAFTTLNRFVALKMLESRQLVQECITKGEQSGGYREFCGMAPGIALLPDATGYRLYIESLFDEFSTEIKVLFDRRDAASVLWPKRQTFEALLIILNAPDLSGVWGEDETIGWVYQFFNSGEERRKMRDESASPRNSRELAVRNQFFTPRYVVQFLVDNTLGRLWLEMHGEDTRLAHLCEYLVRSDGTSLQARLRKDPRDLRILDPACDSGHFLLYTYDLLLAIYEEAWSVEVVSPKSEATGRSLREDYPDLVNLRRAVPRLIVEYNLHGVDIDPRCAQIAALALWLRAQRAWKELGIAAPDRPRINRTHIVVAEPIPGDALLVEEFAARLDPPLLRDLFRKMVAESRLAGELGTLLRIEDSISVELRRAREQFVKQRQTTSFLPGMEPLERQGALDLSGIDEDHFFHEAEARIVQALHDFAATSSGTGRVRRRLFVGDAAQGVALVDLVRTRFDVILMNPPFGDAVPSTREALENSYPSARLDLYACFVCSALDRLLSGGRLGVISSRLGLFLGTLESWRSDVLLGGSGKLEFLADLGHNVLDGALVEAAAYVISLQTSGDDPWACGLLDSDDKSSALLDEIARDSTSHWRPNLLALARELPGKPIPYWLPVAAVQHLVSPGRLAGIGAQALVGLQTDDDFRFVRLSWEVIHGSVGVQKHWHYFAKGGEYSPYYDDIHLVVNWSHDAHELKSFIQQRYSWTKNARSAGRYGEVGLTYPERTTSEFSPRPLPKGTVFSIAGPSILCRKPDDSFALLALFYTRWYRLIIEAYVGGGDAVNAGSAARHYKTGIVNSLPLPPVGEQNWADLIEIGRKCSLARACEFSFDETSRLFNGFPLSNGSWEDYCGKLLSQFEDLYVRREELSFRAECIAADIFGLAEEELAYIRTEYGLHPAELRNGSDDRTVNALLETDHADLCRELVQQHGFSRQISKLSHWTNKTYETVAHVLNMPVHAVVEKRRLEGRVPKWWIVDLASKLISYWLGVAVGRWTPPASTSIAPLDPNLLLHLPERPPAESNDRVRGLEVMVDDPGHQDDILLRVTKVAEAMGFGELDIDLVAKGAGAEDIRQYIRKEFFDSHISKYSKSRRSAPVYWQIATKSASYSIWLYSQSISKDTLYNIQNDYVVPKLTHEERKLAAFVQAVGSNPSAKERKEITAQEAFVEELRAFLDDVKCVAPLWSPTPGDGTALTMAPLWRLVPQHTSWQKGLRAKWDELSSGDHDWANVAMHLWPERVVPKCAIDRSFAIAHGLEEVLWVEGDDGKWKARQVPLRPVDELVGERTSVAVKAALEELVEASAQSAKKVRTRRPSA